MLENGDTGSEVTNYDTMSDDDLDSLIENNPDVSVDDVDPGVQNMSDEDGSDISPTATDGEQTDADDDDQDVDPDDSTDDEDSTDSDATDDEQSDDATDSETNEGDEPDVDNSDDSDSKDSEEDDQPSVEFQPLRARGKEYPIDSIDELYTLASKGLDYTAKMQELAPMRRSMATMQKHDISEDDINLLVELKAGNSDAILSLVKKAGLDPMEMDLEAKTDYKPGDHQASTFEVELDEVVGRIANNPMYKETMAVVTTQWDERSKQVFLNDPSMIENLNREMQPGPDGTPSNWDIVSPRAEKLKALGNGNKSDYDYYMEARQHIVEEVTAQQAEQQEKADKAKADADKKKAAEKKKVEVKKKKAAPTGGKEIGQKAVNFDEMNDAELDAWLAKNL